MNILIADDEKPIRTLVRVYVEEAGHAAHMASDGLQAVEVFEAVRPDLAILDVMMPRLTGFEVCEHIRSIDPRVPVLFLSAKGDIVDKKTGFRAGADDYLTKPFDPEELMLRVDALLRRRALSGGGAATWAGDGEGAGAAGGPGGGTRPDVLETGAWRFDLKRLQLSHAGREVQLTPKEFQILSLLAEHEGTIFSAEELVERIWGPNTATARSTCPSTCDASEPRSRTTRPMPRISRPSGGPGTTSSPSPELGGSPPVTRAGA